MAALFAAGCGGGSQGGGTTASQARTSKVGEAVTTYFGQPKPQTATSSGSVSVLSQAGASFTAVTLEPPPNLDDTYLVFGREIDSAFALYKLPWGAGTPQLLFQSPYTAFLPSISAYGEVLFIEVKGSTYFNWQIHPDGTGLSQVTFTGASEAADPRFSVDGTNRVAFWNAGSNLYIAPGAGGASTLIQSNATGTFPAWNPAGNELVYESAHSGTSNTDLFITSTSGGTATDTTPTAFQGTGTFFTPSWSPDGVSIVATYQASGSSRAETLKFAAGAPTGPSQTLTPSTYSDHEACFSPDGSKLVFYRDNTGGATPGVYVSDAAGDNQTLLLPDSSNPGDEGALGGISWSPFLPKETVVAASGSTFYHQAASGFLLSQVGDQFGSFIAFTATTPSSAAVQTPSGISAGAPMVFTITADAITSIGYINNYFNPGTTVTLSSTPSVVVSVDAVTGQVDLVAPATSPKASPIKNGDGTFTYNARFSGLYDGTGKNLAPSGASQITVNPKTGKLLSFK